MTSEKQWALFKGDEQVSKAHPSRIVAITEAYEKGVVIDYSADFVGDSSGRELADGYSIREVEND